MASCEIVDFDDGHKPALLRDEGAQGTKLALNRGKQSSNFVSVYDNLLPLMWAQRIYDYAVSRKKPWGAYVLTSDLLAFEQEVAGSEERTAKMLEYVEGIYETDPERSFAVCATWALVMQRARGLIGCDMSGIHGTAVWCLCSGLTNSVEYHIDYAELYRYETNIIHPPLYAGTCQVTPLQTSSDMKGGDFRVNTGGIEHYRAFGYKGKLKDPEALGADLESSCDWHTVRYKFNRSILHDGDLPHLSTPVEYIAQGLFRVIMGFNCFTSQVGECCLRAPEHSQAFNRTVKLYQRLASASGVRSSDDSKYGSAPPSNGAPPPPPASQAPKSRITAKDLLKNPALAKLIVMAANKVKGKEKENEKEKS
jgi:hypothetical protein